MSKIMKTAPPIVQDYQALIAKAEASKDGQKARRYRAQAERLYAAMTAKAQRQAGIR